MSDFHVVAGPHGQLLHPAVRTISYADLWSALRKGIADFAAQPSHLVFLGLIYPIVGVFLASWTSGNATFELVYPLMSGFALIGPFAAIGLYEVSRRRELGLDSSWKHAFEVLHSPAIPAIAAVGAMLFVLFLSWLLVANAIFDGLFGAARPASLWALLAEILGSTRGWTLILVGNAVGLVFAVVVLATTVIAFPLLLDRDVGAVAAIETSVRAVVANPGPMAAWGLIVAVSLAIGSLPLFAGLAVVMPVLGHATWHLYRKVVVEE